MFYLWTILQGEASTEFLSDGVQAPAYKMHNGQAQRYCLPDDDDDEHCGFLSI